MDWSLILAKCWSFSDDPSAFLSDYRSWGLGLELCTGMLKHTHLAENVPFPDKVVICFFLQLSLLVLRFNLFGIGEPG